jgi:DNA-binding transcriptional regulator GbsR (MarR family)
VTAKSGPGLQYRSAQRCYLNNPCNAPVSVPDPLEELLIGGSRRSLREIFGSGGVEHTPSSCASSNTMVCWGLQGSARDAGNNAAADGHPSHLPQSWPLTFACAVTDISVMTEISKISVGEKQLPEAVEKFILHWGDMGSQWGVNRTVAQIHALLYVSERPLTADEIAAALGVARSNVSNSLRELLGWELIRRVPIRGDRRDHFEAESDIWELVRRIAAGRKAREIDPALLALRACVADAERDASLHPVASRRLKEMLEFTQTVDRWYAQMLTIPKPKLAALLRLGAKVIRFLPADKAK